MGLVDRLRKLARFFVKLPPDHVSVRHSVKPTFDERKFWKWLGLLALVVGIFGFATKLLNLGLSWIFGAIFEPFGIHWNPQVEHAEGWELGAIFWSVGFTLWFYWTFQLVKNAPATNKKIILLLLWAIPASAALAVLTIWWPRESTLPVSVHIFPVFVISFTFASVDKILSKHHKDARQKRLFEDTYLLADIPAVVAFAVLAVYQIFQNCQSPPEDLRLFVSGAVSFQLIASTIIFALIHLEMVPSLRRKGKNKGGSSQTPRPEDKKSKERRRRT